MADRYHKLSVCCKPCQDFRLRPTQQYLRLPWVLNKTRSNLTLCRASARMPNRNRFKRVLSLLAPAVASSYSPSSQTWAIYLDSTTGVIDAGSGTASAWNSTFGASTNFTNAVGASQPAINTSNAAFNNKQTIRFITGKTLVDGDLLPTFSATTFTLFMCFKLKAATAVLFQDVSAFFKISFDGTNIKTEIFNNATRTSLLPYTSDTKVYIAMVWDPAGSVFKAKYRSGAYESVASGASGISGGGMLQFRVEQTDNYWGVFAVANSVLSETVIDNQLDYMFNQFGS